MTLQTSDYNVSAYLADIHDTPLGSGTRHTILRTIDRRVRHIHLPHQIANL
jgi:hypothetical protein